MSGRRPGRDSDVKERWAEAVNKNPDDPQLVQPPGGARAIARRKGRPLDAKAGASSKKGDDDTLVVLDSPDDV